MNNPLPPDIEKRLADPIEIAKGIICRSCGISPYDIHGQNTVYQNLFDEIVGAIVQAEYRGNRATIERVQDNDSVSLSDDRYTVLLTSDVEKTHKELIELKNIMLEIKKRVEATHQQV